VDYKEILAPCGLNCKKCLSYKNGEIKNTAVQLQKLLGSFDFYAKRFSAIQPVFNKYPEFKEFLEFLINAQCEGCRSGGCVNSECKVHHCHKEQNVDFCAECSLFPCDKTGFPQPLQEKWLKVNSRIKEIGVEKYYEEVKELPRYS